jgi:hydroxyacylglutathione hydrolase
VITVHQFPCLSDNYGYLVHDDVSGETACVDTPDADAILAQAAARRWRITHIWNTHWHPDHAGGNAAVKAATGASITCPDEVARLGDGGDRVVVEGDTVTLGGHVARVIAVGGHTLGHIAYVFDEPPVAFVGDALFALGCGRMFEGTPELFWASLTKLAALPDDALVYCAHEYTQSNARFARSVDGDNEALRARAAEVDALRAAGRPTVPSRMGLERATNPFLRAPELAASLGMAGAPDHAVFGELRRRKDSFR